jgi:hypothetical protein
MTDARCWATGPLPSALGNKISDAIFEAIQNGMEVDEATCVVVAVAADYARESYGGGYLAELAGIVLTRAERPRPEAETN